MLLPARFLFHLLCSALLTAPSLSWHGSNNILYPKDDREQKVLLYACRNCDHQVPFLRRSISLVSDPFGSLSEAYAYLLFFHLYLFLDS